MSTQVLASRYTLGEVLGTGGMATVWRARDEVLGREVAVKVLSPQYASDASFLGRFEREARHAAALNHPRLVTVFDCGVDGTTPFIVMELVAGRTLRQILDEAGTLPPEEAVRIAAAVCEGLEVAHAAGLVHRDITPANIVLAGQEVKVLDFGIARAEGGAGVTRTAAVLGTATYLSPEQASGGVAGSQSDLYSLGCVLFEMLTGAPPFSADSPVGLAYRHVHDEPAAPSALRPGLPARLDRITARLLAKDPAARPPSAAAARAGLLAALGTDSTAVLPSPPSGPEPRRGWRKHPAGREPGEGSRQHAAGREPGESWRGRWHPAGRRGAGEGGRGRWRQRPAETALAVALAASLAALAVVLLTGSPGRAQPSGPATHPAVTSQPQTPHVSATPTAGGTPSASASQPGTLPPAAAAAGTFVGDLQAAVADGQVTRQAGQDLFNHLQELLFGPPDQDAQQVQQQYEQLVQAYDQHQSQGQITGQAASRLRAAVQALGAALGAL